MKDRLHKQTMYVKQEGKYLFLVCSNMSIVRVVSFVVHHKFVVHEVEAVGASLKRIVYHQIYCDLVQPRKLVDVLAAIYTVRNAESKVKIKRFKVLVTEKMSFNHSKFVDRFTPNLEFYRSTNCPKFQKLQINQHELILILMINSLYLRCKLISNKSSSIRVK